MVLTPASTTPPKKRHYHFISTPRLSNSTPYCHYNQTPPKRGRKTLNPIDLTPLHIITHPTTHDPGNQFRTAVDFIFNDHMDR